MEDMKTKEVRNMLSEEKEREVGREVRLGARFLPSHHGRAAGLITLQSQPETKPPPSRAPSIKEACLPVWPLGRKYRATQARNCARFCNVSSAFQTPRHISRKL